MNIDVCVVTKDGTLPKGLDNIPYRNLIIETSTPLGEARRRAISKVKSEIFAFIDDDIIIEKGWYETLSEYISLPNVGAVVGIPYIFGLGDKVTTVFNSIRKFKSLSLGERGCTHNTIIKYELVKDWKPSVEGLSAYEDYDITQHIIKKGYKWFVVPANVSHLKSWRKLAKNAKWVGQGWRKFNKPKKIPFLIVKRIINPIYNLFNYGPHMFLYSLIMNFFMVFGVLL